MLLRVISVHFSAFYCCDLIEYNERELEMLEQIKSVVLKEHASEIAKGREKESEREINSRRDSEMHKGNSL